MTKGKGTRLGAIEALWRYPVKSMLGEAIRQSAADERGLLGDRSYALLDRATGFVASAKHPQKWSRLLQCRAAYVSEPRQGEVLPPVLITLPDGRSAQSTDAHVNDLLSEFLQREVSLIHDAPATPMREADRTPLEDEGAPPLIRQEKMASAAPAGTFFDYAPVHLLTTAALRQLQMDHADSRDRAGANDARRFRPNLIVDVGAGDHGYVENTWLGRDCVISGAARLKLIDPSPRCVIVTSAHGNDLPREPQLLRTLARHNCVASVTAAPGHLFQAVLGVYARVLEAGSLRVGDPLVLV